ncbi:MAG TPA: hypothetical protein VLQ52_02955 [Coriobacteriia bacterium]|nr:hypothetical protein [Coriobacteriia bacterium]
MTTAARNTVLLALSIALLLAGAACVGPDPSDQVRAHFEGQGIEAKEISINSSPHEAQVMMDLMILNSHGITDAYENELEHATVTLENGEEVPAVLYKDKVYTYKDN